MYRFRLQFLLNFKIQKMKRLSYELLQAEKRLKDEMLHLESLRSQACTYTKDLEDQEGPTFLSAELAIMTHAYHRLLRHMEQQGALTQQLDGFVATKRQDLIKIQQDIKILEKLQEKQYQQYMLKRAAYEQQILDEITTMRFYREHIL